MQRYRCKNEKNRIDCNLKEKASQDFITLIGQNEWANILDLHAKNCEKSAKEIDLRDNTDLRDENVNENTNKEGGPMGEKDSKVKEEEKGMSTNTDNTDKMEISEEIQSNQDDAQKGNFSLFSKIRKI